MFFYVVTSKAKRSLSSFADVVRAIWIPVAGFMDGMITLSPSTLHSKCLLTELSEY